MEVICPKGHHWEAIPYNFSYQQNRCAICNGTSSKEAKKKFLELCKLENYEVLTEYVNKDVKVTLLCPQKHKFEVAPRHFKSAKNKCPECYKRKFREKWDALMDCARYTALSEYKNRETKVLVRCNWCGKEFFMKPWKLYLDRRGCPRCGGTDNETAKEIFYIQLTVNNIQPLEDYINNCTPVKVVHIECGTTWKMRPDCFRNSMKKNSHVCPLCKK
ncbi:hypothetical protein U0X36_05135 [Bacillus thuringiensis]|nr:hypothetical protein [Bacillus thuringiensis]MDZ3952334.1 hypothetical protein [Bacillus thuringiensis]RGP43743.1 hypothetical protein BTW32_29535 [Bacillus thuringiensis]